MIKLADKNLCTGCSLCASVCSNRCIKMETAPEGDVFPEIDVGRCIKCHMCERACPVISSPIRHLPDKAFAAWSRNESERYTSASGGIAAELYHFALSNNYWIVGAKLEDDFSVKLKLTIDADDIELFKNSKYVYSDAGQSFIDVKEALGQGKKVLVMGLPCQIAGFRKIFPNEDNIMLVEILCHGTTPYIWLKKHIESIEKAKNQKATRMSFRDPAFGTKNYVFSLYNEKNECFYNATSNDGDAYQIGYHRAITYRESCYNCKFATRERVGDIVLCDFYGLGKLEPCSYCMDSVSCILTITQKGTNFLQDAIKSEKIFIEERPLQEAINGNPRLSIPNHKNNLRKYYEKYLKVNNGDFEITMNPIVSKYINDIHAPKWKIRIKALFNRLKAFKG